jgi:hypothetical protein
MLLDVVQKAADAVISLVDVGLVMAPDVLCLNGTQQAFSRPIFRGLTHRRQAALHPERR